MSFEHLLKDRKMVIVGAGLAGLLAANFFKRYNPLVIEAQQSLPNNHQALLRFRSDAVSKVTGIPFKKVKVSKAIWDFTKEELITTPNIAYSNQYSYKVSGKIQSRSIDNLDPVDRYIAPTNLIEQLSEGVNVTYSTSLTYKMIEECKKRGIPIISTIPMPVMKNLMDEFVCRTDFEATVISAYSCDITYPQFDVYQTIYFPDDRDAPYRLSITGNHLIVEQIGGHDENFPIDFSQFKFLMRHLFLSAPLSKFNFSNFKNKSQPYGKLVSPNPSFGKEFIYQMTKDHGVYSLGRFATWRQILLDDCVKDCESIQRMIESGNYLR